MIEAETLQPQTAAHTDVGAFMQKEASLMENLGEGGARWDTGQDGTWWIFLEVLVLAPSIHLDGTGYHNSYWLAKSLREAQGLGSGRSVWKPLNCYKKSS